MKIGNLIENKSFAGYMLCNEAIFRAAIESDVKIASFYPGTPLSEILNVFSEGVNSLDYKMEISINEKVALETAAGGAMAGLRSITAMKSVLFSSIRVFREDERSLVRIFIIPQGFFLNFF